MGTVTAQVSILRRMGLVTSEPPAARTRKKKPEALAVYPKNRFALCPPHFWYNRKIRRTYLMATRTCRLCGEKAGGPLA
jgi:hypothetical protein